MSDRDKQLETGPSFTSKFDAPLPSTTGPFAQGYGEWWVELPDGSRQDWLDNMTIPAASAEDRGRGQRLLAAYHGTSTAAAPATSASGGGTLWLGVGGRG